jgi:preprotein translocase subunit SecA
MALMDKLNIPEDEPLESRFVTKAIENAQKRVEAQNFQIRKRILDMDDVMNVQRNVVYKLRRRLLEGEDLHAEIEKYMEDIADVLVARYALADAPELWEIKRNIPAEELPGRDYLEKAFKELTGKEIEVPETVRDREDLKRFLIEKMKEIYAEKENFFGKELMRELERMLTLQILDFLWRKHLHAMDRLKEGIYLRGYAQRDPVTEYKKEAYQMFENFLNEFKFGVLRSLFNVEIAPQEPQPTQVVAPSASAVGELRLGEVPQPEPQSPQPSPQAEDGGDGLRGALMEGGEVKRKPRAPAPRRLKDRLKERKK